MGRLEFVIGPSVWAPLIPGSLSGCVCSWALSRAAIYARSSSLWCFNASYSRAVFSWAAFSRLRATCSRLWS